MPNKAKVRANADAARTDADVTGDDADDGFVGGAAEDAPNDAVAAGGGAAADAEPLHGQQAARTVHEGDDISAEWRAVAKATRERCPGSNFVLVVPEPDDEPLPGGDIRVKAFCLDCPSAVPNKTGQSIRVFRAPSRTPN